MDHEPAPSGTFPRTRYYVERAWHGLEFCVSALCLPSKDEPGDVRWLPGYPLERRKLRLFQSSYNLLVCQNFKFTSNFHAYKYDPDDNLRPEVTSNNETFQWINNIVADLVDRWSWGELFRFYRASGLATHPGEVDQLIGLIASRCDSTGERERKSLDEIAHRLAGLASLRRTPDPMQASIAKIFELHVKELREVDQSALALMRPAFLRLLDTHPRRRQCELWALKEYLYSPKATKNLLSIPDPEINEDATMPEEHRLREEGWLIGPRRAINDALGVCPTYDNYLEREEEKGEAQLLRLGRQKFAFRLNDHDRQAEAKAQFSTRRKRRTGSSDVE